MRRSADLPRRRSWLRTSGRAAIIGAALFIVVVIIFGRAVARFYIDALWFDGLGQSGVFWGVIRAKLTLFGIFFVLFAVLAGVNMAIADKLAPSRFPINVHPFVDRLHDAFGRRLRLYRYLLAGALALLMALPAVAQWRSWLLYRNAQDFGKADDQFGVDVGFYVFELPFLSFVLDWLFFALILVLLVTVIAHVLNGGVMFASPIPTLNSGTRGHLAVLLAVLAALKAADYWVRRYEATNERRGFVQGATYSVVHAQLPALLLLAFVALVTAALYVSTLKTESWRLPLISSAVWMVLAVLGGYIYPAAVQGLVVNPNQKSREAAYIERNVYATRQAMGIEPVADVVNVELEFSALTAEDIAGDTQPLEDVRLLNPVEMQTRFVLDEANESEYTIADLDVDRYALEEGGDVQQVLIGARELDLAGVPNRSWQGRHLIYTRGCGVVMAPAGRVRENGTPDYYQPADLERPELYFSPSLTGYAIAGTEEPERACDGESAAYEGTAGVEMSSFARRLAFGLAFMDYNVVASGAIDADSQMLWVRNVRDRVEKLAPFLSYDGDPYPVVVDGAVLWVIDAYTSTGNYPYAEEVGNDVALTPGSGIPRDANYVRNSVKAVVNAYDGSVTLYVLDDDDPIIQAWMSAFPNLFTDDSDMPAELREHLRYPEDLFRVQSNVYSKYQLEPDAFFDRSGAWSVAQNPGNAPRDAATSGTAEGSGAANGQEPELATELSSVRFTPYYTMFGTGEDRDFVVLRPFVPFSRNDDRQELQAFMTASSDPDSYGQLRVYEIATPPDGPLLVSVAMENDGDISERITLSTREGRGVRFGDLQLVPVADGLLWVRPFYLSVERSSGGVDSTTEYEYVIVSYDGRAEYDRTIGGALAELFPGLEANIGDRSDTEVPAEAVVSELPVTGQESDEPPDDEPSTPPDQPDTEASVEDLLAEADELLRRAEEQLREDGDLGAYQDAVDEASGLVEQALELVGGLPPSSEPDTTESAAPTTTESSN